MQISGITISGGGLQIIPPYVPPAPTSVTASFAVSGWNQEITNTGTITGPAPLNIFFDATGTTSTNGSINTYRQLGYHFDFGYLTPTTPGIWTYNTDPKGNQLGGPLATHIYETPGTYTASVRAQDADGNYSDRFVTIVVQDPDVVYAGTSTVCISLIGDFTGAPAGATTQTSVPTSLNSNTRYLFRCGEDYSGTAITVSHSRENIHVGSYGSGAKPIVKLTLRQVPPTTGNYRQRCISVYDIESTQNLSPQFADYVSYLRVDCPVQGLFCGTVTKYYYNNPISNQDMSLCTWPKNITMQECYVDANYLSYCGYFLASRYSVQGNYMINPQEHVVRIPLTYKGFIAHNYFGAITNDTKAQLKMHSSGSDPFSFDLSTSPNPSSQYGLIADNYVPADLNNWQFNYQPQNAQSYEVLYDGIFERNDFASDPASPGYQHAMTGGANRVCFRDNTVAPRPGNPIGVNAHSDPGGGQGGIPPELMGPYYVPSGNDLIDNVQVFANDPTILPAKAGTTYIPTVIVTNQTELDTELAKTAAQLEGQIIGIQYNATPYVINRTGTGSLNSKDFGTGGLIFTQYGPTKPLFSSIAVDDCTNVTFHSLEVYQDTDGTGSPSFITLYDNSWDITIDSCEIHGKYYDPNGNYYVSGSYAQVWRPIGGGQAAGKYLKNITIKNNVMYNLRRGHGLSVSGIYRVIGNTYYNLYEDPITSSYNTNGSGTTVTQINWNVFYNPIGVSSDQVNPHVDFIQFLDPGAVTWDIEVIGNIGFIGDARGDFQGVFCNFSTAGAYITGSIKGNMLLNNQLRGISIDRASSLTVIGNTVVSGDVDGGGLNTQIRVGEDDTTGSHTIKNNVSHNFALYGTYTSTNNYTTARSTAAYSANFNGTVFDKLTISSRSAALAAYAMRSGGPLNQAVNIGADGSGYVNYDTRTINTSME